MSGFEEKLNAILSDPGAMAQVMELAQSLNLGDMEAPSPPAPSKGGDVGGLGDLLGSIDPGMLTKLMPLVGELTGGQNDERVQLLYALRPFLRPERQEKVDRAVQAAKLIRVGRKLLKTMGEQDV